MTGISFQRPIQQYLQSARTPIFSFGTDDDDMPSDNPVYSMFEGDSPRDWAENIFLGLSNELDERPEIQDIESGNNENTGPFSYQSTGKGNNTAIGEGDDSVAIQYTGNGHNNAKTAQIFQFTEQGNNVGEGNEITQYSTLGDNRATGDEGSLIFQDTEEGTNNATGDTISQYTDNGHNIAEGIEINQYSGKGNNEATGRGEGSIQQATLAGNNTASNATFISQSTSKGTNTATGTDEDDTIIQQGGGTATGGLGDDQFYVQQDDSGDGNHTFTISGGKGSDTINLYGEESDWTSKVQDGKTIYTNSETGDIVTLEDFNQDEDSIQFGTEVPTAPETNPSTCGGENPGEPGETIRTFG